MPRPKYILCAESFAHDKVTNLMSFFNVIEGYSVTRAAEPIPEGTTPIANAPLRLAGIAAWELNEGESVDEELEYELTLKYPGEGEMPIKSGEFRMAKRFHRFTVRMEVPGIPVAGNDTIVFRSKVRRRGDEWCIQEYTIPIDVTVEPIGIE